jgi:iron complex outermembrane receptor protein
VLRRTLAVVGPIDNRIRDANGNILTRWNHTLSGGSDMSLQLYDDYYVRRAQGLREAANTVDLDFHHHIHLSSRNDVVWGLGYRVISDQFVPGLNVTFSPLHSTDSLFSTFFQDQIKLTRSVSLTLGSKLERNAYSGFEYEPSAQLVWTPTPRQTIWLSASQAIRQPSRQDTGIQFDESIVPLGAGNFGVAQVRTDNNIQAEQLRDYELGYRAQITKQFSLDVALFRSYYRDLETLDPGAPFLADTPEPPHEVFPVDLGNGAHARTYGAEVFATWNVTSRWRLSPGYSLVHMGVIQNSSDPDSSAVAIPGDTPKHQIQFRSTYGLRSNLDWDTSLYFVGALSNQQVPGYTRLDTQLRWRLGESIEFSLTGQNLLTARHTEFVDTTVVDYTQVRRSAFARITWKF